MRLLAKALLTVAALCLLQTAPAQAGSAAKWYIDPPHSAVTFTIRHILAQVPGQFLEFSGDVAFAPETPETSSINFTISTASVNTHVAKRDEHLRTPDFLDTEQFPHMTFVSESIEKTGADTFALHGVLTIKDVSRKVTLPLDYLGVADAPMREGRRVLGLRTAFDVDRLAHGVGSGKFYEMGVVGKDVHIVVHLELLDQQPQ